MPDNASSIQQTRVFPTPDDRWVVMEAYFREKGLVRQHLDSYNDFVGRVLREIIEEHCEIPVPTIKYILSPGWNVIVPPKNMTVSNFLSSCIEYVRGVFIWDAKIQSWKYLTMTDNVFKYIGIAVYSIAHCTFEISMS